MSGASFPVALAYSITSVVDAARSVGVLDALAVDGPASAAQVATRCGLDRRAVLVLVEALVALGLIETDGAGIYRIGSSPLMGRELWAGLEQTLRSGEPAQPHDTSSSAAREYPARVEELARQTTDDARLVAELLAAPNLEIFDLASGAAQWSRALVVREPTCRVTAVDLPEVLETTRRLVGSNGAAGRFTFLAADLTQADLGESRCDLALVGNLCHLLGEEANRALLLRVGRLVRPGGRVAIIDVLPGDQTDVVVKTLYDMSLLLRTSRGGLYALAAYAEWLSEAGFVGIERTILGGTPVRSVIVARRPR